MMHALEQRLGKRAGQHVREFSVFVVMLTAAAMALVRLSV
jgi:hypothetical protein